MPPLFFLFFVESRHTASSSRPLEIHPFLFGCIVRPRDFAIFTTHPKLSKYFKSSKESHFWNKIPVIIAPNFEIGAKHYVPCIVFLFYHCTTCGRFHHVRPRGFERLCPKAIFLPSIFCRSLSGTAGPLRRRKHLLDKTWKCSTNLPNPRFSLMRIESCSCFVPKHRQLVFAA